MLVLTRELDERIMIGNDIVLTVCSIRRDRVQIGIQAPLDIPVHREEVWLQINGSVGDDGSSPDTAGE